MDYASGSGSPHGSFITHPVHIGSIQHFDVLQSAWHDKTAFNNVAAFHVVGYSNAGDVLVLVLVLVLVSLAFM